MTVAAGQDVGGDFQNIPACRSADQTGCVVAYSSFNEPPPPDSCLAGWESARTAGQPAGNVQVLCVNPASLSGGTGALQPYFGTAPFPGLLGPLLYPRVRRTDAVGGLPRALHRPLRKFRRRQLAAG